MSNHRGEPYEITDEEYEGLKKALAQMDALPDVEYTVKSQARQTGCSIYISFDKKTSVQESMNFIGMMTGAPAYMRTCIEKLIAIHERSK